MKIYIDNDYKCHLTDDGSRREFETDFFEGKCEAFVEGYRYIPPGETWTRKDGEVFAGEMVAPWQDYNELYRAQLEYELEQAKAESADAKAALEVMGVNP